MIEPREFLPRPSRMARFAARRGSVRTLDFHPFSELFFMRVHVAAGTGPIFKSVLHWRRRPRSYRLVTIRAENRHMRAGQGKPGVFVHGESKPRGLEALNVVTSFATIQMRGSRKLSFVNVHMAIPTLGLLDFEQRIFSLWPF